MNAFDVLTVDAVVGLLGCAATTVREHSRKSELPGLKFGDDWVFPAEALQQRLTVLALERAAKRRNAFGTAAVSSGVPTKERRTLPTLPTPR